MVIKKAAFVTSAAGVNQILQGGVPEVAVVGRSNVGKSSFINFVAGNGKLAKTSKEPGRTRLINYFDINDGELMLVDLPGYGFARVTDAEKRKWGEIIEAYLRLSKSLRNVFVLLDIRRDVSPDDVMMINYLYHYGIPFTLVCTKSDKLSRAQIGERRRAISASLKVGVDNVLVTSALNKQGKEEVLRRLAEVLAKGE